MKIIVPIKFVPDLVEEMEIDPDGAALDRTFMSLIPNEQDDHALEEAYLLKERYGGTVTVITLDTGDVDETLFTAVANGAESVIKIWDEAFEEGIDNHAASFVLADALKDIPFDLILTGTQAVDDLDGSIGALLAARLGLPYVGYIISVAQEEGRVVAHKEYPGGLVAEVEVTLPAVLGVQAAEQPPRYVVTDLLMQAMKSATIEEMEAGEIADNGAVVVEHMYLPESDEHATMLEGDVEQVADEIITVFQEHGVL